MRGQGKESSAFSLPCSLGPGDQGVAPRAGTLGAGFLSRVSARAQPCSPHTCTSCRPSSPRALSFPGQVQGLKAAEPHHVSVKTRQKLLQCGLC